ncbi:protein numb-like isoform X2 [Ptychodera flava]|uniref:protein numb-like isoform X2 n=1 Tax=Ptychodera flava TaxID=63121 RepID=UPI00396A2F8B
MIGEARTSQHAMAREVPSNIETVDKCYITDRCRRLFHSSQNKGVRVGTNNFHRSFRKSLRKSFRMKKLRRSLSKRETYVPECSKPHQWQEDEKLVKAGTCNFPVKYLGSVEVAESRGMPICEEAVRKLRDMGKKKVRAILWVSSDGLRVVDEDSKGLIVDQTIEKVSFCAPDRNNERAFSYICRDGTTRRWLCHAFIAQRDSGERLSHAVGCAFSACLERKQKRDKECGVKVEFDVNKTTFARQGSFREPTLTEKLEMQKREREAEEKSRTGSASQPPIQPVYNPHAVPRRHATAQMLQRQGSFRGFPQLSHDAPFKRQLSLRLSELPSTLQRQKDLQSLQEESGSPTSPLSPSRPQQNTSFQAFQPAQPTAATHNVAQQDSISSLCQQLSMGLDELSSKDPFADFSGMNATTSPPSNSMSSGVGTSMYSPNRQPLPPQQNAPMSVTAVSNAALPIRQANPWENTATADSTTKTAVSPAKSAWTPGHRRQLSDADRWLETAQQTAGAANSPGNPFLTGSQANNSVVKSKSSPYNLSNQTSTPPSERPPLIKSHTINDPFMPMQMPATNSQHNGVGNQQASYANMSASMAKSSPVAQQRTFNGGLNSSWTNDMSRNLPARNQPSPQIDPFDAQWSALANKQNQPPSPGNPFNNRNVVKTFEINL